MDTLIELIVQGLIALFSGGGKYDRNKPPARPGPLPAAQQQQQQYPRVTQQRANPLRQKTQLRQQPQTRKQPLARRKPALRPIPGRQPKRVGSPPPIPIAAPVPRAAAVAPAKPVPPVTAPSQPAISATGIRQLLVSRKSALKSIYVLSEVIGPPLALRESTFRDLH